MIRATGLPPAPDTMKFNLKIWRQADGKSKPLGRPELLLLEKKVTRQSLEHRVDSEEQTHQSGGKDGLRVVDDAIRYGEARCALDDPQPRRRFAAPFSLPKQCRDPDHDESGDRESSTGGGERRQVAEAALDHHPGASPDET